MSIDKLGIDNPNQGGPIVNWQTKTMSIDKLGIDNPIQGGPIFNWQQIIICQLRNDYLLSIDNPNQGGPIVNWQHEINQYIALVIDKHHSPRQSTND